MLVIKGNRAPVRLPLNTCSGSPEQPRSLAEVSIFWQSQCRGGASANFRETDLNHFAYVLITALLKFFLMLIALIPFLPYKKQTSPLMTWTYYTLLYGDYSSVMLTYAWFPLQTLVIICSFLLNQTRQFFKMLGTLPYNIDIYCDFSLYLCGFNFYFFSVVVCRCQ